MKKILFSTSILLFTMCTSCDLGLFGKKEPQTELEKLPPITQTGENTFGCLVNGEAFVVRNTMQLGAIYQKGILQMGGGIEDENFEQGIFILFTDEVESTLIYDLSELSDHGVQYTKINIKTQNLCEYGFDNTYDGFINFSKIDRTNYIISGTFEFSTVNDDCDTVRVTDGRFDIQYTP